RVPVRGSQQRREYVYYRCLGTDRGRHQGQAICRNACLPVGIEEAIWSDVKALLREPGRLREEFARRLAQPAHESAEVARLEKAIYEHKRRIGRLLDAYENGWVDKSEFEPRMRVAKERLAKDEARWREQQSSWTTQESMHKTLSEFADFA